MLDSKSMQKVLFISAFLGLTALIHPTQALAWSESHRQEYSGYQHGRHHGRHHGRRHEYPRYYDAHPQGRFAISFPHISVSLPIGCHRVFIDGRDYYTDNNVYYQSTYYGYQIVEPPVLVAAARLQEKRGPDSFTVNIPSSNGAYTAVILKRSGSGYVGPQGEFYREFPSVEQLRLMYAK